MPSHRDFALGVDFHPRQPLEQVFYHGVLGRLEGSRVVLQRVAPHQHLGGGALHLHLGEQLGIFLQLHVFQYDVPVAHRDVRLIIAVAYGGDEQVIPPRLHVVESEAAPQVGLHALHQRGVAAAEKAHGDHFESLAVLSVVHARLDAVLRGEGKHGKKAQAEECPMAF